MDAKTTTQAIRTRVAELTKNVTTHVGLDAVVARGGLRTLVAEFPDAVSEVLYEWASMKLGLRGMTNDDD